MILPYMVRQAPQEHVTESYVSSPPALVIVDAMGNIWTLGLQMMPGPMGEFSFDVLRNGQPTGGVASRIEYQHSRVRIFGTYGYKRWTGHSFV